MNTKNERGNALVITLIVLGVVVLPLVIWGVSVAAAPIFGKGDAYKKTETGDYRIANYDRFKDNCNSIKALDGKIEIATQTLKDDVAANEDKLVIRQSRLNVVALKNQRVEAANAYNADAQKTATRAKFRDSALPYNINPTTFEGVNCP